MILKLSSEEVDQHIGWLRFAHPPMFAHPELKSGELVMGHGPIVRVMDWVRVCHSSGIMPSARASNVDSEGKVALIVKQSEYCECAMRIATKKAREEKAKAK